MSRCCWWLSIGAAVTVGALAPGAAAASGTSFAGPAGLPPLPAMYGIACPSATTCVGVGGAGVATVVTTTDGGGAWTTTQVAGIIALYGVACVDATHCVAVGTSNGSSAGAATTRDGHTWSAVASLPSAPPLISVSCVARSRCMAVGARIATPQGWVASALVSFDGGATWGAAATPMHQGLATPLNAVRCPAIQRCVVAGGGAWVTDDFGGSWQDVSPPDGCAGGAQLCRPTYSELTGIDFTDASHGVVVGGEQCGGQGVKSCPSVFFSTTDGAASWTMSPPSDRSLPFMDAVLCSGRRCLVTSDAFNTSTVLSTADGASWTPVGSATGVLNAIACAPGGLCAITGNNGSAGVLLLSASGLGTAGVSPAVSAGGDGAGGGGAGADTVVSSFSTSLPTPASVASSASALLLSALLVLALVLLVVFPSQLFNRTYEANHERIRDWWERRLPRTRARRQRAESSTLHGVVAFVVVVAAGALLGTLLDPRAGLNLRSAALFTGIALAVLLTVGLGAVVTAAYRRARKRSLRWEMRALPSGLIVAAACVLISRLVGFQPGYLYGVIGGVAFAGALPRNEEGHLVALSSVVTLAVSAIAWLLWVPVSNAARPGGGFGIALLANVLSALFVGGLVGVVLGLVPLRFLPGEKLARWHWGAWMAVFGVAMFGLLQIMLRPQSSGAHVASVPLWTTVGLFVVFGAASVAFWGYFRAVPRRS